VNLIDLLLAVAEGVGGYAGIFVVSILGNLIPFIPIPYLVAVYLYAAYMPGSDPLLVGLVSGLGGGIGKLVVFYLSREASRLLSPEKRREMERLSKMLGNYGAAAVFIFAATPSPDDVVIALLGVMKYDVKKFFVSVTAGKILISVVTAYTGRVVVDLVGREHFWESLAASIALFVIAMVFLTTINWSNVLAIMGEKGLRGLLEEAKEKGWREVLYGGK